MPLLTPRDFEERAAWEWAVRCFGQAHCENRAVRLVRFFEEACELVQTGVSEKMASHVLKTVFERPKGSVIQEIGGCEITLSVLSTGMGVSRHIAFQTELLRCLAKSPEHFSKRNDEKLALGLTGLDPAAGPFEP